jgi:hypothetical protein
MKIFSAKELQSYGGGGKKHKKAIPIQKWLFEKTPKP